MLLARTARSLYWAGRYLERAEDMARVVLVHGDIHVDLPVGEDVGWQPLLAIAGQERSFEDHFETATGEGAGLSRAPGEADVAEFLLLHARNPTSIASSISQARECLRLTRTAIPTQAWELCNELWLTLSGLGNGLSDRQERVRWLRRVVSDCDRLAGTLWGTMRRDGGLGFLRIGQSLERADLVCRVLSVRATDVVRHQMTNPYDQIRAMAVLRSLASHEAFARMRPADVRTSTLLGFLLLDEAYPRSVAACLSEIRGHLKELPNNENSLSVCADASVHLADAPGSTNSASELRDFLAGFQLGLAGIHDRVHASYFDGTTMPARANHPLAHSSSSKVASEAGERPEGRTYRVTHRTLYRYQSKADHSYNEAHLHPRDTERQHCLWHSLIVGPEPSGRWERTDSFGNQVTKFEVEGGFDSLSVTAESLVHIVAPSSLPRGMPWESVVTVLERDRQPETQEARRYRTHSRLVPSSEVIAAYAQPSFARNRPFVDAITELCSRIHDDFAYEPGFTSVGTPMLEAFGARKGVCQDFAHVAIACLRSVGLAARYVSGYLETTPPPGHEKLIGTDASHAWVSAYLPGLGWIDVDPTNNQVVSDRYITLAWGLDYFDVSPLRGIVEGGGTSHELEVKVDVEADPASVSAAIV